MRHLREACPHSPVGSGAVSWVRTIIYANEKDTVQVPMTKDTEMRIQQER